MAKNIQYLGFALIVIPAFIIIAGHFLGWQEENALNLTMVACMVIGIVVYVIAGRKAISPLENANSGKGTDKP